MCIVARHPLVRTALSAAIGLAVTLVPGPQSSGEWADMRVSAHLASFGSWEITRAYLQELFPDATGFLRKRDSYSSAQVAAIEAYLGFKLYPEDREPEFYIAVEDKGGKRRMLGVALFIDPRVESAVLTASPTRLEVGVGVDAQGRVHRVRVFEYKGNRELIRESFLGQFVGMTLADRYVVGARERIKPTASEPRESQLVANAVREALYLMQVSMGRRTTSAANP